MNYSYLILIFLGFGILYGQDPGQKEFNDILDGAQDLIEMNVDSAFLILETLERGVELTAVQEAALFKVKADAYFDTGELDTALNLYQRVFHIYDQNKLDSLAFEALFEMGMLNRKLGRNHDALRKYEEAKEYSRAKELKILEADAINAIGVINYVQGNTVQALEKYLEARKVYEIFDQTSKLAKSYNNIGIVYKVFNDYEKAIEYYRQSIDMRKKLGNYHKLGAPYFNINELYHFIGEHDLALQTGKEALALAREHKITKWERNCHMMLAGDYLFLDYLDSMKIHIDHYRQFIGNDLYYKALADQLEARYFLAKEEPEKGIELLFKALAVFEKKDDLNQREWTYLYLSDAYLMKQEYAIASRNAKKAYELAVGENFNPMIRVALQRLYKIYEAKGDMINAFKYLSLYQQKQDSTYNETKASIVGGMEAEQKLVSREQENLLLQKDTELKGETIKQQNTIILFSVIASLLLAIIAFLFYKGQVQKRKLIEVALQVNEEKTKRVTEELEYKNREIVNFAWQITEKNEFIDLLNGQIEQIKAKTTVSPEEIKKVTDLIKSQLSISKKREEFDAYVENVCDAFFKRLEDSYPGLSPSDKRLAALLRLNLSSKEIASVVNISPKSVDMNRYRLRKKMDLENEANLTEVLQSI